MPNVDRGLYVDGEWGSADEYVEVVDKYSGEVLGRVGQSSAGDVDRAVGAASRANDQRRFPRAQRVEVLGRAAELLAARRDHIIAVHTAETGFTLHDSEADWRRAVRTLQLCAEETKRIAGEIVPLDWYPGSEHTFAYTVREPIGPVCAITPFNSPLNTVVHKVGPALAAGNPVVLKPAVQTPLSAIEVCATLDEAGLPAGFLNVVFGDADTGDFLLRDERIGFYAFTGSTAVGHHISQTVGLRRCQLELGSNAPTIVCDDADVDKAVSHVRTGAFRKAGQVCTSVQRLLVHRSLFDDVAGQLAAAVSAMEAGDPRDPASSIGPMISEAAATRVASMVDDARAAGAKVVAGGRRDGGLYAPTVLTNVAPGMRVVDEELFGPVVGLIPFRTLDEAILLANATPYGLAAGVFTERLETARIAGRLLRCGTVQINASSSNRFDSMPFGGCKDSGHGKEGPRYAIRSMTNEKLVVLN